MRLLTQRTKRLIERGEIFESVIGNAEDFSNEQTQSLLIEIFSSESVRAKVEYLRSSTEREGQSIVYTMAYLLTGDEIGGGTCRWKVVHSFT